MEYLHLYASEVPKGRAELAELWFPFWRTRSVKLH
jgi:hypothetical protein